jgi:DNA-directed RNA polymerase specialized sigma24 family protein
MPGVLAKVIEGDLQARTIMIESHLRLALALVARYVKTEDVVDDLVSAAFYAVTYAVNRIASGYLTHDNPTGYIVTFVHGELKRELAKRAVIYTPEDAERVTHVGLEGVDCPVQPDNSLDVEEELDAILTDAIDSKIVRMLALGYLAADVAKTLSVHKGNVSRRIARIRAAYQESQV